MTTVTRQECAAIAEEVKRAVIDIFAAHGLEAPTINGVYGPELKLTLRAVPAASDDELVNGVNPNSEEARAYKAYYRVYGLPEDCLGVEFTTRTGTYRFTGIAPRRPKFPICGVDVVTGKAYKFTETTVAAITRAKEAAQ